MCRSLSTTVKLHPPGAWETRSYPRSPRPSSIPFISNKADVERCTLHTAVTTPPLSFPPLSVFLGKICKLFLYTILKDTKAELCCCRVTATVSCANYQASRQGPLYTLLSLQLFAREEFTSTAGKKTSTVSKEKTDPCMRGIQIRVTAYKINLSHTHSRVCVCVKREKEWETPFQKHKM